MGQTKHTIVWFGKKRAKNKRKILVLEKSGPKLTCWRGPGRGASQRPPERVSAIYQHALRGHFVNALKQRCCLASPTCCLLQTRVCAAVATREAHTHVQGCSCCKQSLLLADDPLIKSPTLSMSSNKRHHSFLPWQQCWLAACVAAMCNNGQPPHTQP